MPVCGLKELAACCVAGAIAAAATTADACSCATGTPREFFDHANMVLAGVVVAKTKPELIPYKDKYVTYGPVTCRVAVEYVWKGEPQDTIDVITAATTAECGYRFEVGGEYLIFTYVRDGKQHSGSCGGTNLYGHALGERYLFGVPSYSADGAEYREITRDDLFDMLDDSDIFAQIAAARGIGYDEVYRDENLDRLGAMLDTQNARMTQGVLYALANMHTEKVIPMAMYVLVRGDKDQRLQAVSTAARAMRGPVLEPVLRMGLQDPVAEVRKSAAFYTQALGLLEIDSLDPEILLGLIDLLGDTDADARKTAATTLGWCGAMAGAAVADLEVVRDYDRDPDVRREARDAIIRISPEDAPLGTVVGRVVGDVTGEPMAEANVYIRLTRVGARTDSTGAFVLVNVPAGEGILQVSLMGYRAPETGIMVSAGDTTWVEVRLKGLDPGK